MLDREVSLRLQLEVLLWAIGIGLAVLAIFIGTNIGALGVALCVVGATLVMVRHLSAQACRDFHMFELGQESVRSIR